MNIHENACVTPAVREHCPDRDLTSPAHDGRADRDPALQGALVALEPKPTRTQAARPALRIRSAGRDDPYRHEKARPHRENRPSHHRRQNKPEKDPRHWLGAARREERDGLRFHQLSPRLVRLARCGQQTSHERQRQVTPTKATSSPISCANAPSSTCAHAPPRCAPTARPGASSRRACANGLTHRRIKHPPSGPAPSCSGPFGARQTRCRDQHQGRRDCDGDRAHGHAEPERPLFELFPDIGRHRMRADWR